MENKLKNKNEYNPDTVTSPHHTILETMEAKNIDLMSFVLMMMSLFEPEQTEALLRGEIIITEEVAIQLEAVLDVPAQFWLNRQKRRSQCLHKILERDGENCDA